VARVDGYRWRYKSKSARRTVMMDCVMPNSQSDKHLERLIVQSYVWVLRAPRTADGQRVASLSRHGLYEVRLLEPSEMAQYNDLPFWVELFDSKQSISVDSYAGDDIEETAAAVQHLISRAKILDQDSDSLKFAG
jgi:hypothetical protein